MCVPVCFITTVYLTCFFLKLSCYFLITFKVVFVLLSYTNLGMILKHVMELIVILEQNWSLSREMRYSIRVTRQCLSGPSKTRMKFSTCTRSHKRGEEMRLPMSFVGRLIGHRGLLHVDSKLRIMRRNSGCGIQFGKISKIYKNE